MAGQGPPGLSMRLLRQLCNRRNKMNDQDPGDGGNDRGAITEHNFRTRGQGVAVDEGWLRSRTRRTHPEGAESLYSFISTSTISSQPCSTLYTGILLSVFCLFLHHLVILPIEVPWFSRTGLQPGRSPIQILIFDRMGKVGWIVQPLHLSISDQRGQHRAS